MNRHRIASIVVPVALLLTACGGDGGSGGSAGDDVGSDSPSGVTSPVELPTDIPGVTDSCAVVIAAMGLAATAMGGPGDPAAARQSLDALVNAVPDDLKDDAAIFAEAYGNFLVAFGQSPDMNSAMTDPEFAAALEALDAPEVRAAGENLTNYFDTECAAP